jgi:hypothetical protein
VWSIEKGAEVEEMREAKFGGSAGAVASDRVERRRWRGGLVSQALRRRRVNGFHRRRRNAGTDALIQFTPKIFMTAAWNTQVWGREIGNPVSLNLAEFQRNRAKLKFAYEF